MSLNHLPALSTEQDFMCLVKISDLMNQVGEPKPALSRAIDELHQMMIFDNLVVYAFDQQTGVLDAFYARAMGRGKQAEADIDWGEKLANQLLTEQKMILEKPKGLKNEDRLKFPFLLGIPIFSNQTFLGAVILIRFGGPEFDQHDLEFATFFTQQIGMLFERQNFQKEREFLQARQEQLQLQEDFLSTISHELNSPLGFIKGYTTTLLRPDARWEQDTQLEFLKIIDQETDHMQELISNLLDSARAQSNQLKMDFETVCLDSLINDILARAHRKHPDLEIATNFPGDLSAIDGDPKRLTQVLENLISNSTKYAPGSPIEISIQQDNLTSTILFSDQGPGIAPIHLGHIFERFFRIPNPISGAHGSGLGLYICQKIIFAHKGIITAESTVNQGTSFRIIIPNQQ